jgi:hypothetical protein
VVSHFAARKLRDDMVIVEHDKFRPARPTEPFTVRLVDVPNGGLRVQVVAVGQEAKRVGDKAEGREMIVLERLVTGPGRTSELCRLIGCPERTALRTLKDLVTKGRIFKWPDGMYRLTESDAGGGQKGLLDDETGKDDED